MDQETQKLLVVTNNTIGPQTAEYALKVAVRLDLEIILLFVDEPGPSLNKEQRHIKVQLFESETEEEAAKFSSLAWKSAVKVTVIVDVDERENAIARTLGQDQGIRFILSEDTENPEKDDNTDRKQPRLTVIRPD